jgi:hypothetical protein
MECSITYKLYDSLMLNSHHLALFRPGRGCLSKYIFIVPLDVVAISNQCLRTYNSRLPWRHFPVSRQVRSTVATSTVRPRHTKKRGSPGSPEAMREVSQVAATGMTGSSMNRSCMANVPLVGHIFREKSRCALLDMGWRDYVRP